MADEVEIVDERKEVIRELWYWQKQNNEPDTPCFTSRLFTLIQTADLKNLARLTMAFPMYVQVMAEWQAASDPEAYFAEGFK